MGVGVDRRLEHVSSTCPFAPVNSVYGFFGGGGRAAILEAVIQGLGNGQNCVYVHGESGSGKTMLAAVLAERCQSTHNIIRYDREELTASSVLHQLMVDLCPGRIKAPAAADSGKRDSSLDELAREAVLTRLGREMPGGKPILLILDSAERMHASVKPLLDELSATARACGSNFQTVVFDTVDASTVRKYASSIESSSAADNHYWLRRLTLAEISEYVQHTMLLFDFNRRNVFSREMTYFIADRSGGVFAAINQLARSAFTIARLDGQDRPSMAHLLVAGLPAEEDVPVGPHFFVRHRKALFALLGSFVVVCSAVAVLLAVN